METHLTLAHFARHSLIRFLRSDPHLYSTISKARLAYSRYVVGMRERKQFNKNRSLFKMSALEERYSSELRAQGFTILDEFFGADLIDTIFERADYLFRNLKLDFHDAYSVQNKRRSSLEGLSYDELARSEKMIVLNDPLLNIPECIEIAFNESLLKIVTNFLGYLCPWYKVMILRDFPADRPREASNFHRDNDETDSIQVFVYLVDIDDTHGPLVYVPGSNRHDVTSCRPRLSSDLGTDDNDGRVSDMEIERYYPRGTWQTVRVKRGSVAIIHGNGFHKGPAWPRYSDPANQPRTAIRLDFHGHKLGLDMRWKGNKLRRNDYVRLSQLQKLFAEESALVDRVFKDD